MKCAAQIKAAIFVFLTLSATSGCVPRDPVAADPPTDSVERDLEIGRHERLLARMAENGAALNGFTTDGCSGGLSRAWERLAARFPEFAVRHGEQPPWQECCVTHDRQYHVGSAGSSSAGESFERRKKADLDLKGCVVDIGVRRSAALRETYGLTEAQVRGLYEAVAELMYRAVRLGGVPCTDYPWRWGYGWPACRQGRSTP